MSVSTEGSIKEYTTSGSAGPFEFPYKLLSSGDLKVYLDGTQTSAFSIAGSGESWTVTLDSIPASGLGLVLIRETANTQGTPYENAKNFDADVFEGDFDRRTLVSQERDDDLDNKIGFAKGLPGVSEARRTFPDLEDQTNVVPVFNGSTWELRETSSAAPVVLSDLTVSNFSAARAIVGSTLTNGDIVYINGHTSQLSGEGVFQWDSTETTADDNGFFLKLTDTTTGRLVRQSNFVSVEHFGATGVGDNSTAIQAACDYLSTGGTLLFEPGKTYLCNTIICGDNLNLVGWGATLKRNSTANEPVIAGGEHCLFEGFTIDGDKTTYTGSSPTAQRGCIFGSYSVVSSVVSHNNPGDGIRGQGTGTPTDLNNFKASHCKTYSNGTNPGASGTGDGIYVLNGDDCLVDDCVSYSNSRWGITSTTYDGAVADATLSTNTAIRNCHTYSNSFNGVDMEAVTRPIASNLKCEDGFYFSSSPNAFVNGIEASIVYGTGAHNAEISKLYLSSVDTNQLYVDGNSPIVSDVVAGNTTPTAGNVIDVQPADSIGSLSNISVDGCYNGIVMNGITNASNLSVLNEVNVKFKFKGGFNLDDVVSVSQGISVVRGSVVPATGDWLDGDRIQFTALAALSAPGAYCVVAGTSGTWENESVLAEAFAGTLVWDPGSLADGVGETSASMTVTGASLGDYVQISAPYDLQGITANGYVDAANSVKIRLQNETTGTIDLASGTWKARVTRS